MGTQPDRLNRLRLPVAGGTLLLAVAGGTGTWFMTLYDELHADLDAIRTEQVQVHAEQAVDRSMILNHASRMDTLEVKIEGVRLAPTGISVETRPRIEALEREIEKLRDQVRQLERGN